MKIDFHLHTRASFDCDSEPSAIIEWAVKKGLDGMFVTEHDSTDGYDDLKRAADKNNLIVLPGVEFTAARGTHYLVYLTPELPLPQDDLAMIMEVHRRGGLVGLPHPYRSDTGLLYNRNVKNLYVQSEVQQILAGLDFIEVFNAKSNARENQQAIKLAEQYPHLKQIAGSDSHFPSTVGAAHTEITGFKFDTMKSMAGQLKSLEFKLHILPELEKTAAISGIQTATEGVRRLLVKFKPIMPGIIWRAGKALYRTGSNRIKEKQAAKSIVGRE